MDSSDLSVNMQRWGIPEKEMVSAENTLLERLVWVPYKGHHWWPALLYENYTELQAHMYEELDMVLKAQFAVAIMRQMNESKQVKIARLLGREVLEVVEVDDNQHAEFYWQLPRVLPMACKKSRYGDDIILYLDFHRALDQVEEIIRDISKDSFNLTPNDEKKTWIERAEEVIQSSDKSTSVLEHMKQLPRPTSNNTLLPNKAATDKEESNFLFSALDSMMDNINNTYERVSGDVFDMTLETSTVRKNVEIIQKTHIEANTDANSDALLKQKEYRAALRDVIAKQRQCRISHSTSSRSSDSNDEAYNPSSDGYGVLRTSISTEVLPGSVLGLNNDEPEQQPDEIALSRSYSRQSNFTSCVPELRISLPNKSMSKNNAVQTLSMIPTVREVTVTESREENPVDNREVIKAAARAAAAVDLDMSFWDHMTCHTLDS